MEPIIVTQEKTSKDKIMVLCQNYKYYKKRINLKSTTINWVCANVGKCSASITTESNTVVKINGVKVANCSVTPIQASHNLGCTPVETEIMQVMNKIKELKWTCQNNSKKYKFLIFNKY